MKDYVPTCTVKNIHHVGIAVKNLESAIRFYTDVFGVQKSNILENAEYAVRGVLVSFEALNLELLQGITSTSPISRFIVSRGEGLHHLCFGVDDIHESLNVLRAKDLPLLDDKPRDGLLGKVAFIHPRATNGVLVEIAQH